MSENPQDLDLDFNYDPNFFLDAELDSEALERILDNNRLSVPRNPDDYLFQSVLCSGKQKFVFPMLDDQGKPTSQALCDKVIAMRGVFIRIGFGFSQFDGIEKSQTCQTVSYIKKDGSEEPTAYPFLRPQYAPAQVPKNVKGKDDGEKPLLTPEIVKELPPGIPNRSVSLINPIGSRGFSCEECVETNQHIGFNINEPSKPFFCRSRGRVIFAVFQLGYEKPGINPQTNQIQTDIDWVSTSEAKDNFGRDLFPGVTGPVILKMNLNRTQTITRKSSKRFLPVVEPFYALPIKAKTFCEYVDHVYDKNIAQAKKLQGREKEDIVFMEPVSVYAGIAQSSFQERFEQVGFVPMVLPLAEDPMFQTDGVPDTRKLISTIQTAWQTYYAIRDAGLSASTPPTTQAVGAAAPQAAIPEASSSQQPTSPQADDQSPVQEAQSSSKPSVLEAFGE